jgi:Protein of unknown function (DUF1579)
VNTTLLTTSIALAALTTGVFYSQQSQFRPLDTKAQSACSVEDGVPLSPEQEVLKKWVGTWDATIESTDRDGKLVSSKAKSTVKLAHGDRWLITDFDGMFMGAPFTGQEVLGYDPVAKKYILNWIDSAATSFSAGEGTFDTKTQTMTLTVSGRDDKTGKITTWQQVDTWKDSDNHEWTIRVTPKDGKEQIQMTIRYRRRS